MLRSALRHRKISRLAELLKIPRYAAVGLVECLWHLTAVQAPRGDIGKLTDQEIAEGVFWPKRNSKHLIDCLSSDHVRLLDRCSCHRLRVHDWYDHSDQSVKKTVAKYSTGFLSCYLDKVDSGTIPESHRNDSVLPEPVTVRLPVPVPVPDRVQVIDEKKIDQQRQARMETEKRLTELLLQIRESGVDVQQAIDAIPCKPGTTPLSVSRWHACGNFSHIADTPGGLALLSLWVDKLEHRQRAQAAPVVSDNNRKAFDAIDRVTARMIAQRDGTPVPKEIAG